MARRRWRSRTTTTRVRWPSTGRSLRPKAVGRRFRSLGGGRAGARERRGHADADLRLLRLPRGAVRDRIPRPGVSRGRRRGGWPAGRRGDRAVAREAARGWDHGLWVPLRLLFPDAAVPIVQVSLPVPRTPESVSKIGAALAPLRDQGVMLIGSGGVVHNLRRLRWDGDGSPEPWARAFDEWVAERLERAGLRRDRALSERGPAPRAGRADHRALRSALLRPGRRGRPRTG